MKTLTGRAGEGGCKRQLARAMYAYQVWIDKPDENSAVFLHQACTC